MKVLKKLWTVLMPTVQHTDRAETSKPHAVRHPSSTPAAIKPVIEVLEGADEEDYRRSAYN